ncbi:PREDICTED: AT5G14410 [Prunus dulcis]|uniref:PREDICTED: AT5G14410 n=1 Tax=Prunus dulcis TaxID=3755 RepID=A0A5E4FCM2_PRUDU|nr:uncharacterized protein LOC117629082 [Prunus dulcis]KAI5329688.1 hypothetical protein L3X38_029085 [Prunus dulcis]VVA25864.1 PREDICTED: AT5G14410 [Prunus dulcis]
MASVSELAYQRLRNEGVFNEEPEQNRAVIFKKTSGGWSKIRKLTTSRRRPRVRVLGLRRFLGRRARLFTRIKVSWSKALKRLKNGQAHMNDLFGGNYLFMQANPLPFKCGERPYNLGHGGGLHGSLPSRYSVGRMV